MSKAKSLQEKYPWTQTPLLCCAPMARIASPLLIAEVTKAGGLGFIGGGYDVGAVEQNLITTKEHLSSFSHPHLPQDLIPVGLGILCFASKPDALVQVIQRHTPAAMWLFAPKQVSDYTTWVSAIRAACPKTQIWIQTGSVAEALTIAESYHPDVLVIQGSDAGGHGLEKSASIVTLLPEAADALRKAGHGDIPLLAAGGIVDGRGVAAALTLGAVGAVMGTRFIAAEEAQIPHALYREALLAATDGGQSTVRATVFDEMNATGNIWPAGYDGRAFKNLTFADHLTGVGIEDNRARFQAAAKSDEAGYRPAVEEMRPNIWAGSGVGLVNEVRPTKQIVESARADAKAILDEAKAML